MKISTSKVTMKLFLHHLKVFLNSFQKWQRRLNIYFVFGRIFTNFLMNISVNNLTFEEPITKFKVIFL